MGGMPPTRGAGLDLAAQDVAKAAATLLGRRVRALGFDVTAVDPQLRFHTVTAGLVRVRGVADGDAFSLIVKQTQNGIDADPGALWVSGADPSHRNYWKREWLAYAGGLLADLPGRLRAPRLLLATEPSEDTAWIWLEDVQGRFGPDWESADYASAAHDLGTTQGSFASGNVVLPDQAWLSRGWLDGWLRTTARWWPLVEDDAAWRDACLAPLAGLRPRARAVWAQRDRLRARAASAPRTVVHLDFWPSNVVAGDDGATIAIDWSSVGIGGLAQDLDQLTLDPVWMQVEAEADLDRLEHTVLSSYGSGVRSVGCTATDRELRGWYAAAAALRYTPLLATQADLAADRERVEALELRWQRPIDAIMGDRSRVMARAIDLAEEALHTDGA